MTSIRKVALACVASAVVALPLSAGAQTGPRNQDTYFTFSQAVELPNTQLPAGKYFFQLMDSDSNRHIVKVMSEDRSKLHTTLLAIPFYSNERPADEPQVRFMETPATAGNAGTGTNAIKVWFYPGTSTGHEFIYPRSQAMRLAQRTGESVLTTKKETEITETVADSELTRVDRSGQETAVDLSAQARTEQPEATAQAQASARTETTTQQPVTDPARTESPTTQAQSETRTAQTQAAQTQTQAQTQSPAQTAQTQPAPQPMTDRTAPADRAADTDRDTTRTDLPNTAGLLPLLALIGIGSLVGSRMLRRSRVR